MAIPQKLYKYRSFDVRSLTMVTDHGLFFANPRYFNDPLDCSLSIYPDINPKKLSELLKSLMGPEREDEWNHDVACAIRHATEEGDIKVPGKPRDYLIRMLTGHIEAEVSREFDAKGVLSFSETWESVLMWSHYADEHRGICLEFDTSELPHPNLAPVRYDGDRSVKASDVYAWRVVNDSPSGATVFDSHFHSKAPDWHYEQEWRDIAAKPGPCGDYRISGICFGFRCEHAVKVAVSKMLGRNSDVDLYEVWMSPDNYELGKREVDRDEIEALGMREPMGIEHARTMAAFEELDAQEQ